MPRTPMSRTGSPAGRSSSLAPAPPGRDAVENELSDEPRTYQPASEQGREANEQPTIGQVGTRQQSATRRQQHRRPDRQGHSLGSVGEISERRARCQTGVEQHPETAGEAEQRHVEEDHERAHDEHHDGMIGIGRRWRSGSEGRAPTGSARIVASSAGDTGRASGLAASDPPMVRAGARSGAVAHRPVRADGRSPAVAGVWEVRAVVTRHAAMVRTGSRPARRGERAVHARGREGTDGEEQRKHWLGVYPTQASADLRGTP